MKREATSQRCRTRRADAAQFPAAMPNLDEDASLKWLDDGSSDDEEGENVAAAVAKDKGNASFAGGRYEEASKHFTLAINLDKNNHVLYSNRSACWCAMVGVATSETMWSSTLGRALPSSAATAPTPSCAVISCATAGAVWACWCTGGRAARSSTTR